MSQRGCLVEAQRQTFIYLFAYRSVNCYHISYIVTNDR